VPSLFFMPQPAFIFVGFLLLIVVCHPASAAVAVSSSSSASTSFPPGTITTSMNDEPNPPVWPPSVKIFHETDDPAWIQKEVEGTQDPYYEDDGEDSSRCWFTADKHFTSDRTALLFAPGTYRDLEFEVGYYVQVAGLGRTPEQVEFVGGGGPYVPALNQHLHQRTVEVVVTKEEDENGQQDETGTKQQVEEQPVGTCLDSFWRSAENFAVTDRDLQWAVSQAAPLRRVHVTRGNVYLHDGEAYASGGHFANSRIVGGGLLQAGGQQQFLVRNVELERGATGGAWSMVYAGCTGQVPAATTGPTSPEDGAAVTVVEEPRVRMEKPFVAVRDDDPTQFVLRVPKALLRGDADYTTAPLLDGRHEEVRDFSRVRVVRDTDPIGNIQQALEEGKDVVLAPGIFRLEKTIVIQKPGRVLLGLGLATLEAPRDGTPCIRVAPHVSGVRIAGVMLEATEKDASASRPTTSSSSLLEWGDASIKDLGVRNDPGGMFDVFARVGGATVGNRSNIAVDTMMRLHSGHVVGDNLWLWRADHARLGLGEAANYPHISPIFWQSEQHEYRAETGIEVKADDVSMYGLAVEHANGHQTVWSGENGSVVFYQCEFPYGVYRDFAENEFRGYLVQNHVESHEVHAPGIYSNFRNDAVHVSTAIEHPEKPDVHVINPFTVKLDNQGGILSIANGKGGAVIDDDTGKPARLTAGLTAEER